MLREEGGSNQNEYSLNLGYSILPLNWLVKFIYAHSYITFIMSLAVQYILRDAETRKIHTQEATERC